ncbi:hypothetical protein Rrhod_3944 [Rhodococcus rhodnii LMG 5362]|uniref:Uncharacterized protein n=1 Tax=Rhodococcus rhodnii LMG 5362 TaxID=1273125 RepID=R7WHY9_9NOCA|nr:hypothetical protein Rrhod_3944 [Rhodococcus rhodnii LMG 5362]
MDTCRSRSAGVSTEARPNITGRSCTNLTTTPQWEKLQLGARATSGRRVREQDTARYEIVRHDTADSRCAAGSVDNRTGSPA